MPVLNPFTGETLDEVSCATSEQAIEAVGSALKGFYKSRALSSAKRSEILCSVAGALHARQAEFALSIANETGKTLSAASKEVLRAVNTLTLSAEEAKRLNGKTIPFDSVQSDDDRVGYYTYEPIGVVVCITPFNDPLNLVAHKLGPAIASGNSVILKPSEQAPLTALKLVELFIEHDLPECILNVLTGYGAEFGDALVSHKNVSMVSFTGGSSAGERIAKAAGAKKMLMELGANSPVIVMADADIDKAVESCVSGSFWASGHNCIGVQRIFIEAPIYRAFHEKFVAITKSLIVGDPIAVDTDIGPMIDVNQAMRIQALVAESVAMGAKLSCGGVREGAVFSATVFDNPPLTSAVVAEEVFAPVVSLFPFTDVGEAVALSNSPEHRIHGAVFTSDINKAFVISRSLDMSGVMINDSTDFRVDAMPFGGAGRGSLGREGVYFAIREMCNTKVFCFNLDSAL